MCFPESNEVTVDDTKATNSFCTTIFPAVKSLIGLRILRPTSCVPISIDSASQFEIPVPPLEIQSQSPPSFPPIRPDREQPAAHTAAGAGGAAAYKEWFVRLRFPGHEHVRVMDGCQRVGEKKKDRRCV